MVNKYFIYVIIASFIWGTSFPTITFGLKKTNPELLLFLRFFIATIISFFLFPNTIKRLKEKKLIMIGLFNGLAYLLQFIGQKYVPAGQSSILVNFYSILVPIIAIFVLKEVPSKRVLFALIIGFSGVIFLTGYSSDIEVSVTNYLLGVITIFFSGVSWAFYVVYTKKFQLELNVDNQVELRYSNEDLFSASMFYTMVIAFFSMFLVPFSNSDINIEMVLISLYLAVFASVIAFLLYLSALKKISATKVSIILLLEVLVSYFFSILLLKENITILKITGSLLIIGSIIIVITSTAKQKILSNLA